MLSFEHQYRTLVGNVREHGLDGKASKGSFRVLPFYTIILKPEEVPLITSRKMYPTGIIGELKAFLQDAKTEDDFKKHGCNFWGAWTDKPVDYARLLHHFNGVDQLDKVIKSLKERPGSRKHVISLWDPSSDTLQPPCVMHYQWQVIDDTLYMTWSQRSTDVMVGLASDMFSAWLWNQLMARATGYRPGEVCMQLSSCHIYDVHDPDKLLAREPVHQSAKIVFEFNNIYDWDAQVVSYKHHDPIKYELCV